MTDIRLTFIDLWWPHNLMFWNICMMYIKRKLSTHGYYMWQPFFSALDHMTYCDHDQTFITFLDLSISRIDSIIITKNIGVLDINWLTPFNLVNVNNQDARMPRFYFENGGSNICIARSQKFSVICQFCWPPGGKEAGFFPALLQTIGLALAQNENRLSENAPKRTKF